MEKSTSESCSPHVYEDGAPLSDGQAGRLVRACLDCKQKFVGHIWQLTCPTCTPPPRTCKRRRSWSPEQIQQVREAYEAGTPLKTACRMFGVRDTTALYWAKQLGWRKPEPR
jgi:hypothetical protein